MSHKQRRPKQQQESIHLALRVEGYEVRVDAAINSYAYAPQYAWDLDERDPLYKFTAHLTINATSTYPEDRFGEAYELILYADDAPSRRLTTTLQDVQVRDKYGSPKYRQYRDRQIPVYSPPNGLGLLDKIRGESRWTVSLFVSVRFANDVLALLSHQEKTLFVALHERKEGRHRWVQSMSLQTVDPAQE